MTSEGYPVPPDRAHLEDRAGDAGQEQRGYGVFGAPPAADDFPDFTPGPRDAAAASPFPVFGAEEPSANGSAEGDASWPPPVAAAGSAPAGYQPIDQREPSAPSTFGGFPPDTAEEPAPYAPPPTPPSSFAPQPGESVYVPAPAVVPMPTSYSDPAPAYGDPAPSYGDPAAGYGEPAYGEPARGYGDPAPARPEEPSWAQPSPPPAGAGAPAWQSFAPSGPPPAEEPPAPEGRTGSWAFEIPQASSSGWSPFGGESAPQAEDFNEPREYTSIFDQPGGARPEEPAASAYPAEPAPARDPYAAPQTYPPAESPYAPPQPSYAAPEPASYAAPEPSYAAPEPSYAAPEPSYAAPESDYPGSPAAPAASPVSFGGAPEQAAALGAPLVAAEAPATGSAAVAKASVPVASRISPPSEPVPQSRASGRVYGSAAAPAASPAASPAAQVSPAPQTPAEQESAGRIPSQPGPQGRPAQGAATARASVSVGRVSPEEVSGVSQPAGQAAVYGAPAQPAVYGSSAQPAVYGAPAQAVPSAYGAAPPAPVQIPAQPPAPPQAQAQQQPVSPAPTGRAAGMSAFSDLVGTAQTTPAQTPPAPAPHPGQWGAPGQSGGVPGGQPIGAAPPGQQQRPGSGPVPAQRSPQAPAAGDQNRFDQFSAEPEPPVSGKGGTAKVLVMVIAACVLLIGLAFGVLFAVGKLVGGDEEGLAVGQCVQRDGSTAVAVDCASAGAGSFKIVKKVSDQKECPNPQSDALTQGSDIFCLEPNG